MKHQRNHIQSEWDIQMRRLPALLNIARISLLISLITFHVLANAYSADIGSKIRALPIFTGQFYLWAACYGALIMLSLLMPDWQKHRQNVGALPNIRIVADITMLAWLMHLSGGINTGLGLLILPFLVAACLMNYGRYALLLASYAVLLLVISLVLYDWPLNNTNAISHLLQTGVLALCCYVVALLTALAASRLNKSYASLSKSRQAFDRLKGLNDLVLNYVNEAVVVLDESSRILLLNRQASRYFPSIKNETSGKGFASLVDKWQQHPQQDFATEAHILGQTVHVRAHPLVRSDENLLMMFIRSDRDLAAEAMAAKLTALGQLTANLAHEIRNPLSAIRQSNSLMAEEEGIDPERAQMHDIIEGNIQRLDRMLEDISNLNRSDRLNPQSINLMTFWMAFKREFLLTHPKAVQCIRFNMEGRITVNFDQTHLQQILWNLLNNAWNYCSKKPNSIQILVRPIENFPAISFTVIDDGPGVSAENQARLFEPFFTTRSEGTGLGLYVARELAHANRGDLYYYPDLKGFELTLPKEFHE